MKRFFVGIEFLLHDQKLKTENELGAEKRKWWFRGVSQRFLLIRIVGEERISGLMIRGRRIEWPPLSGVDDNKGHLMTLVFPTIGFDAIVNYMGVFLWTDSWMQVYRLREGLHVDSVPCKPSVPGQLARLRFSTSEAQIWAALVVLSHGGACSGLSRSFKECQIARWWPAAGDWIQLGPAVRALWATVGHLGETLPIC